MMKLPYNFPIELINQTAFLVTRSGSFFFSSKLNSCIQKRIGWFRLFYIILSTLKHSMFTLLQVNISMHTPTDFDLPKCVHHLTWFIENKSSHFLLFCLQICRNTLIWTLTVQERCRALQTD